MRQLKPEKIIEIQNVVDSQRDDTFLLNNICRYMTDTFTEKQNMDLIKSLGFSDQYANKIIQWGRLRTRND